MKMTKMSSHFLYHYFCLNFQKKIESNSQTRDSEQRAGESLDLQPSLSQAEGGGHAGRAQHDNQHLQ